MTVNPIQQTNVIDDYASSDALTVTNGGGCVFTDTYPSATLPFCPTTTPSSDCAANTHDNWGFFNRECTSYVAWKINKDHGTTSPPYFFTNLMLGGRFGDAGHWAANAAALGFTVDSNPSVGAIAHWANGELGSLGHVAYVEAVNADGSVDVSEYNFHLNHNFDVRCNNVRPPRFIHFESHDSLANLVPQNISLAANSIAAGSTLNVSWILANVGDGLAPSTVTGVRMNQSSSSASGSPTITNVPMAALNGAASRPQSAAIPIPAGTAAGTYYIWIIADNVANSTLRQSDYSDDFQHSVPFTVTNPGSPACQNPTAREISDYAELLSATYKVPAVLVKAFVEQESNWQQCVTHTEPDGRIGIGLTQVTVHDVSSESLSLGVIQEGAPQVSNPFTTTAQLVSVDIARLKTDWRYNLEVGTRILVAKKKESGGAGDDATILENWYYPLALYNGAVANWQNPNVFGNDPSDPKYSRMVSTNAHWKDRFVFPYQECVFNIIAQLYDIPSGRRTFFGAPVKVTMPGPSSVAAGSGHYTFVDSTFCFFDFAVYFDDATVHIGNWGTRNNGCVSTPETRTGILFHKVPFGAVTQPPIPVPSPPPAVVNTSSGTNITVQGNGATITFASVPVGGMTTVSSISSSEAGQLPVGYESPGANNAYEISTTATVQPPITTCFNVPSETDMAAFSLLRVLHKENGDLIDRTTTQDFASKTVCGRVNSLSPFLIANETAPRIQLSATSYGANEGSGVVTIAVNRLGDTSSSATVNFATNDTAELSNCNAVTGVASSRCDYVTTVGTLKLDPGQSSKNISIALIDDSHVEGDESFTVMLINASGLNLVSPTSAMVTISDNDSVSSVNPISDPEFFVTQHYLDFLNRQPDQSGLEFWTNEITSCGTNQACIELKRINVSAAYFLSIEFQQTGYLVERMYKTAYGDASGTSALGGVHALAVPAVRFEEFLPDTQEISQNVIVGQPEAEETLENNKRSFSEGFVQRSRFAAAFPNSMTPTQFVDKLNSNAGNPLSATQRIQLINDLTSSAKTRAQVLRAVAEDPDLFAAETNRAFVLMQYFGYLRRNPNGSPDSDYTGYDFWLSKLNQFNGNFVNAEMVKAFIVSGEYRQRFGP